MRLHINHISKLEFLCAVCESFFASITERNIQGGFAGAGLVPYDLERVLSKLNVKHRTPTTPTSRPSTAQSWVFQTPYNPREADSQSTLIKNRIANHQNSSRTSLLAAMDQLTKRTMAVMHEVALLRSEVSSLRKANEALSKRRRAKIRCKQWDEHRTEMLQCTDVHRGNLSFYLGGSRPRMTRQTWLVARHNLKPHVIVVFFTLAPYPSTADP